MKTLTLLFIHVMQLLSFGIISSVIYRYIMTDYFFCSIFTISLIIFFFMSIFMYAMLQLSDDYKQEIENFYGE